MLSIHIPADTNDVAFAGGNFEVMVWLSPTMGTDVRARTRSFPCQNSSHYVNIDCLIKYIENGWFSVICPLYVCKRWRGILYMEFWCDGQPLMVNDSAQPCFFFEVREPLHMVDWIDEDFRVLLSFIDHEVITKAKENMAKREKSRDIMCSLCAKL